MATVDHTTIYAITAGIVILIILIVTLINKFSSPSSGQAKASNAREGQPQHGRAMEGPGGVRRRGPRANRMRINQDDSDNSEEEGVHPDDVPAEGKVGAKKMRKLQEKAEKKAMREHEERDREDRKKREQEEEKKRKEAEELEKKEEALKEEEEKKRKEEQERIEHEEYLKMKEMFTVDEEGEGSNEADLENESLLAQFIKYIQDTKVVMMEDLAGHFKLKTQDVIQRVQDLQQEGTLTGVMDDRGKFIYITSVELEAVARYIRQNGRVSISDLAASSNRLINLDPDHSAMVKKLAAEVGDIDIDESHEQALKS